MVYIVQVYLARNNLLGIQKIPVSLPKISSQKDQAVSDTKNICPTEEMPIRVDTIAPDIPYTDSLPL